MAMQIINQIGHLQHWGITPAVNFLQHFENKQQKNLKVLLTGTSDIRHILKTLTDINIKESCQPTKIQIYFNETHKQLLCRALLFLHIIHETQLNLQQRVELFLDLYGNALIKQFRQRNSRYLSNLRIDLLNFIHSQKKVITSIKHFVKLNLLKFQQRDEMSEILQSWSNKVEYDIAKLHDQRLRYMFKQRYDYRTNLIDWDYNMMLLQYAPILHFYHYKQWRMTGLAFEQRFSTYTQPNRTLASYVPGRKKQQRTSCLVRGYWGDMIISPYIAMGIQTNSEQKQLLFKKANMKYVGNSVQLTQYNLTYWLQRIQTQKTYQKYFRDYYRTDEQGKKALQAKQQIKKKKKQKKDTQLKQIVEEDETQQQAQKNDKKQQKNNQIIEKKQKQQELDSEQEDRKTKTKKIDAEDIKQSENEKLLRLFQKYGVQFYPMSVSSEGLTKNKYKQFFDVIVCGFSHSAYLSKQRYIQGSIKKDGQLFAQTARFILPKKKQQRKQINQKLKEMIKQKPEKQTQTQMNFKLIEDSQNYIVWKRVM